MKLFKVLLLLIPGAAILFVLAIVTILFTPFLDEINKIDMRINLKERVQQITKIEMPINAKIIDIKSVSNFYGEGSNSIVLGLTSQETQAFIEKVKNHPDWKWGFHESCISVAQRQSLNPGQLRDLSNQDNSYTLYKSDKGMNRQAVLCPKQNILHLREDNY